MNHEVLISLPTMVSASIPAGASEYPSSVDVKRARWRRNSLRYIETHKDDIRRRRDTLEAKAKARKHQAKYRRNHRDYERERHKIYRQRNKEKILETKRAYIRAHPDADVKARRKYQATQRSHEYQAAWHRKWRQKPEAKAKVREWNKRWRIINRHKVRIEKKMHQRKRFRWKVGSAENLAAIQAFTDSVRSKEWVTCYYCRNRIHGRDAHIDHIKALSRQGKHAPANICVSCPGCNLSKGAKEIGLWQPAGQGVLCL